MRIRLPLLCVFVFAVAAQSSAQSQKNAAAPVDKSYELTPSTSWTDTRIDLHARDSVEISVTVVGTGQNLCDPQGSPNMANPGNLPLESAMPGALLAKLHEMATPPLFVGAVRNLKVTEAGRLYFGTNLGAAVPCTGRFSIKVHVVPAPEVENASYKSKLADAAETWLGGQLGGNTSGTAQNLISGTTPSATNSAPKSKLVMSRSRIDDPLIKDLQGLPRRVNDEFKHPGDMVNFILIGSEKQVQDALAAADWQVADTSTPGAMAKAILMATQKQDYLQMPMSQLYLFGRVQDFGYELAEPYAMVASRHHFRIWKSSVTYNGQPVWAGAGTHDIGFEKDQRNGKITHKIDPKVDGERDHIGETLQLAGRVRMVNYFTPANPVRDARNATGGGYQSDGRVLVIFLQ